MIYIASPYSHPEASVRAQRFEEVAKYTAHLINKGRVVYSPIVHNHPLAIRYDLPTAFDFWENYDLCFIDVCDELIVYCMEGWQESNGIKREIQHARNIRRPISFVYPGDVWDTITSGDAPCSVEA